MKSLFREGIWQIRTLVVGIIVAILVVLAILALRGDGKGVSVWVSTSAASVGQSLSEVRPVLAAVPQDLVPMGALTEVDTVQQAKLSRYIPQGSILTESDLAGSATARKLPTDYSMLSLTVSVSRATGIQPGDAIDIWGQDGSCALLECPPQLLAESAQVLHVADSTASGWGSEEQVSLSVALPGDKIGAVLAATGNESLTLALRAVTGP